MRRSSALAPRPLAALLALALASAACTWGGAVPTVLSVSPPEAPNDVAAGLVISGRDFEPVGKADFDEPRPHVDTRFTVSLVSGSTRVELTGVEGRSSGELHGTLAAGAPVGLYDVEVRDPRGRAATLPAAFRVYDVVRVTTAADEADVGATPASPGGSGLSLREAIAWVNAQGSATHIELAGPMTISMTGQQAGMSLTARGARILGAGGVVLDFGGLNASCLTLAAPDQRLAGVTLRGCVTGPYVAMTAGGQQVTEVTLDASGSPYTAEGIQGTAPSGAWSRIGPGNVVSKAWVAVNLRGSDYEVVGNSLRDNAVGAVLKGGATRIWRNTFVLNPGTPPNKGLGVSFASPPGSTEILQNTFRANGGNALDGTVAAPLTVRNNLFTEGDALAMSLALGVGGSIAHDHNGYFGNAGGDLGSGLLHDPTDRLADPLYAGAPGVDDGLLPGSPAIDAGIDTGLDVNGDAPGRWNGLAPDLGAFESP